MTETHPVLAALEELAEKRVALDVERDRLTRERDEMNRAIAEAMRAAKRDGSLGLTWVQIARAAGVGTTGQSAQVFIARHARPDEFTTGVHDHYVVPPHEETLLSQVAAARRLGVTVPTLIDHLANRPDSAISKRVTVVPPEETGFKTPRYRVEEAAE